MLGQSALLRIRVVGMSVSVNSSSRSTTYAILPGRKSSFLSIWPERNTTRKMFLPGRGEKKGEESEGKWDSGKGEETLKGDQKKVEGWTHPVESWIQSSLPDPRPSWNMQTFESAFAETLITEVLMSTLILCFLLDFLHHVFLFFLFTGDFSSHLKHRHVSKVSSTKLGLLTEGWAWLLTAD